jgi:hypothetical protein
VIIDNNMAQKEEDIANSAQVLNVRFGKTRRDARADRHISAVTQAMKCLEVVRYL